jgi:thymidylate synthase (FAD)
MKIKTPSFKILTLPSRDEILDHLERSARLCYKSEGKIKPGSASRILKALNKFGHHSIFEHVSASVHITCDRGVSHELVRHRIASYSQESTRYVGYDEITVIKPSFFKDGSKEYHLWETAMAASEKLYAALRRSGASLQEARSVLPNSLKTEIMVTANLREWKHIFSLRCSSAAHPQIREIMIPIRDEFIKVFPEFYGDLIG